MKTISSNKSGEALEIAKQVLYSIKVLMIGLFIPFSFVFGITYKQNTVKQENGMNITRTEQMNTAKTTVHLGTLVDQKS